MASGSGGERKRKRSHEREKESDKERVSLQRAPKKEKESEQISAKERVTPERTLEKVIAVLKKESEKEHISAGKSLGKERVTLERTPEKEIVVLQKESEEEHILAGKSSEKHQRVPPERRPEKEIVLHEKEPNKKQISPGKPLYKDQRVPPERTPEKEVVLQEKEQISPGKSSEKERVSPEEGLDKEREKKPTASDSAWTLEAKKLNLLPEVKFFAKELDLQHVDLNNLSLIMDSEHNSYPDITETSEKPLDSPAKVSVLEKTAESTENLLTWSWLMLLKELHSLSANMGIYDQIQVEEGSKKTHESENPDLVFLTEVEEEKAVRTHPPNIETKNIRSLDQNTSPVGTLETMDPEHYSYPGITETSEKPLDSPAKVSVLEKTAQSTENLLTGSWLMLLKELHSLGANMGICDQIQVEEGSKKTHESENPDLVFLMEVEEEKAVRTHPPNIETKNIRSLDQNTSPVGTLETMDPKPLNYNQEHDRNIPDSPRPLKTHPTTTGDEHFRTAPLPPPPLHSQESASGTGSSTNAAITDNEKYAAWYQFAIFNVLTPLRNNFNGTNCHDIAQCIREKYKEVPANFSTEVIFHNALELCTKHILIQASYGSFRLKNPDISFTTWCNHHDQLQNNMKKEERKMQG